MALLSQARKSECGMAHNTSLDLIFVRTVNIPNFSLLPCVEVASHFLTHTRKKPYIEAACCLKNIPMDSRDTRDDPIGSKSKKCGQNETSNS